MTNYKPIGVHRDPPSPIFALICGHGVHKLRDGKVTKTSNGGNLFLADGMFRLDYGPRDVVLMDGNWAHGVSNLRHNSQSESTCTRFSMISFSRWRREKMKKAGSYTGYCN